MHLYAFDDPSEQLLTLNKLILDCINQHAPLRRAKLTRPPAPWMANLNIKYIQAKKDALRATAQQTNEESDWNKYRESRNQLKKEIKTTKRSF